MTSLRVCLISPAPPPYGGISHWTNMILNYSRSIPDIEIINLDISPRWRQVYDLNVILRIIGGGYQLSKNMMCLIISLRYGRYDVVHLTTSGALSVVRDLVFCMVCRFYKINFVYHIRFGRIAEIKKANSLEYKIILYVAKNSFATIAIDASTYVALSDTLPTDKIKLIPNCIEPVDLDKFSFKEKKQIKVAMYLGWVIPTKGINELLAAWAMNKNDGWLLKIAGPISQSYHDDLVCKYRNLKIEFLGELNHDAAMHHLANADIFVFPSYTEGFPNVVIEAMYLSRPIIATKVGAIPEILADNCGLLVESKNTHELSEAINYLITNDSLREQLGKTAHQKCVSEFLIYGVFDKYRKIWTDAKFNHRR